jgi:N-carbamoyl-L-amino-acid hydrolase
MSEACPAPPDLDLAERLLTALAARTRVGRGIVRDSYGAGEQVAHDLAHQAAAAIGLECRVDAIGNLFMTLPGRRRDAPCVLIGSHLDSVNQGGNYDGAAGVAAGLAILAGLARAPDRPRRDIAVMAIRGEESAWFDVPYIGSAGAFGLLDPACLAVRRSDGGATLGEALEASGFDAQAVRGRRVLLDPAGIAAYLELHIEQGPVLVATGIPACAVSGIRGCLRFRDAACHGAYGHSGALPRAFRQDAVAATVALLHGLEAEWLRREAAGEDLTVTSGELFTDPAQHGPSKVAGATRFVIDLRSISEATMAGMADHARAEAARIGAEYRVRFELGGASHSPAAPMDAGLLAMLRARLGDFEMASGAGHDAAVFASQGIRCGMVFVRNENGSHNPDEAMAPADFAAGTRALGAVAWALADA